MDIKGKKAVVFGGTSGIGLAAAKDLAAGGAHVTVISRSPDKAGIPDGIAVEKGDVRDEDALQALFAKLAPFDILISSATGGDRAVGPFLEMDMAGFRGAFDKMWGYANVVRYGAPHLADDGCIVLVSGAPAQRIRPGQIAIGSVGGAVEAFTKHIAKELAPKRINAVSPGMIDTPMVGLQGQERAEMYRKATESFLIPRAGTAEEMAQGILFCVTNEFITGTVIYLDGGWISS